MDLNQFQQQLPTGVLALLVVAGTVWLILMFLAPFFWYTTSRRAREISERLKETNQKLDKLTEVMKTRSEPYLVEDKVFSIKPEDR